MTYRLRHLWLTAAAILALASCTQDDAGEGGSPYDGDSPVVFSATGITPIGGATRATVDGTWEGTEKVTVKVNGVEKTYVVKASSADKKSATLEAAPGVEPFKWSEVEGKFVAAYTTDNVQPDQSTLDNYRASDWLHASVNNMTRTSVLNFEHQVARLLITVSNGDIAKDEVKLVVGSRTITPYRDEDNSRYLALVKSGIKSLSVKIKHGDKDYIYDYTGSEELICGNSYTINVKIFNPMHITDEATLKAWADAVKGDPNHAISAIVDKDFSMTTPAIGGSNWEPVAEFDGIFDGNGHTITGIVVNDNETNYVGFICDNKGTVKNLTLKDAKITGIEDVGAVAGYIYGAGTIENCHVTGASVITGKEVGAVAGYSRGTILACHVAKECAVKGTSSYYNVGGIVGSLGYEGQVTGCYALCSLTGNYYIGGISGCAYGGTSFTACYSKCSYNSSGSNIGGIVGNIWNYNPTFSECYWEGDTKCTKGVGDKTTDPEGVIKVAGNVIWDGIYRYMNDALEGTGYKYKISDDEPLVLVKTQQ